MSLNTQYQILPIAIEEVITQEPKQDNNDDTIAQIIMADDQYKEIIAKESQKSQVYKLKYLKAKKQYYYKS